jgi:HAD superfamily hydrolase (TIGR01509 family)
MTKGYIFDFNGTLFWDTDYHDRAWMVFSKKYGLNITREYLREHLHGKVNREIFQIVFDPEISEENVKDLSEEKEQIYREIVQNLSHRAKLAKGVEKLLTTLKSNNAPMAIATSSPKVNVDFYKQIFRLNRWFHEDRIIYDDGSIKGKPAPDLFLLAAERLNLPAHDCTAVEDSITGIKSAQAAGIGKIFLVASGNHLAWDHSDNDVELIKDFSNFNSFF